MGPLECRARQRLGGRVSTRVMSFRDFIFALLITLAWGGNFIVAKAAMMGWGGFDGAPPVFMAALRFALVAVILAPLLRPVPGDLKAILRLALCVGVLHFVLLFVGLDLASASAAAVAVQLMPPFVVVLSAVMLGERVGWRRGAGVGLAFAGVAAIAYDPATFSLSYGVVLVVGAAACAALGSVWMKGLKPIGALRLQAWTSVFSAPPLLGFSVLVETGQASMVASAPWGFWAALGYVVVLGSLLGHAGYFYLIRRYEASLVVPVFLLVPVWGVGLGIVVLGDAFSWRLLVGAGLALAGVAIVVCPPLRLGAVWRRLGSVVRRDFWQRRVSGRPAADPPVKPAVEPDAP